MTITNFLVWLTTGGCVVLVSWVAEQIPAWHTLSANLKRIIQFAASALLAVGALLIINYVPPAALEQLSPYFATFVAVFGAVFTNQAYHNVAVRAEQATKLYNANYANMADVASKLAGYKWSAGNPTLYDPYYNKPAPGNPADTHPDFTDPPRIK